MHSRSREAVAVVATLGTAMVFVFGNLSSSIAFAVPSHPHGTQPSQWTTWESDGNRGVLETHNHFGVSTEAGDSYHQHYNGLSFGGWNNRRDPWSAYGVWDDERFWLDTSDPFDTQYPPVPHGFIDEYAVNTDADRTQAGVSDHIPDYFFVGANWSGEAISMVDFAFGHWSALQAGSSPVSGLPLRTGLEFERTYIQGNAEILLYWEDIAYLGETSWANPNAWNGVGGTTIKFDSNPGQGGWDFSYNPAGTPADNFHFFSTALHEVGHVVGLEEQNDLDDVMIFERGTGPNGPSFWAIDQDSKEGAYSLYSIPIPEPASALLMLLFGGSFAAWRASRSGSKSGK